MGRKKKESQVKSEKLDVTYKIDNKNPPREFQIKKGEVRNPEGGRAHDPVVREFKKLTTEEMMIVGSMIIKGEMDELVELSKSPKATVLQKMISSIALTIIKKGDMHSLDILLNRLVGKVRDKVDITTSSPQVIVTLPPKEVIPVIDMIRKIE